MLPSRMMHWNSSLHYLNLGVRGHPLEVFEFAHYEARMVDKPTVGILQECFLLSIQVVKMLVTVAVVFIVCAAPSQLIDFWMTMNTMFFKISPRTNMNIPMVYLTLLQFVNSCVNAFIYYPMSE